MNVAVLKDEELEKHFRIVVSAKDLEKSISNEITNIAPTVKLQGFRPGKVPVSFIKKKYGASIRSDVINKEVTDSIKKIVEDKKLKTISNPTIDDVKAEEGKDLEFTVKFELFPPISPVDYKKVKIEKPVVKVSEKDLDEHLKKAAESQVNYDKENKGKAAKDDQLTIDFVGYVDGVAFDGGAMEGHKIILGSGTFIPGFEDQLIGAKAGEDVNVKVTFPEQYHSKDLAGKEAEFKVKVHAVHKPEAAKVDDELAKKFGMKDLEELKARSGEMLAQAFDGEILTMMKLHLFDHFEKELNFNVSEAMLEREYQMIKAQAGKAQDEEEDKESQKDEKKLEESYRRIALRRVRIGLFLANYAEQNKLELTQNDLKDAILAQARMFPGQEQLIIDYFVKNEKAVESLKGPIIEDKAVKAILEKEVSPKVKEYSVKEMQKLIDDENDRDIL